MTQGEELVVEQIVNAGALGRVVLQEFLDEGARRVLDRRRHVVLVALDAGVGVLEAGGLEWRLADQHCEPESVKKSDKYTKMTKLTSAA